MLSYAGSPLLVGCGVACVWCCRIVQWYNLGTGEAYWDDVTEAVFIPGHTVWQVRAVQCRVVRSAACCCNYWYQALVSTPFVTSTPILATRRNVLGPRRLPS